MLGSGGMPSSHSATVTALATAIGLREGTGSSSFAIALVLACVVCNFLIHLYSFLLLFFRYCVVNHDLLLPSFKYGSLSSIVFII